MNHLAKWITFMKYFFSKYLGIEIFQSFLHFFSNGTYCIVFFLLTVLLNIFVQFKSSSYFNCYHSWDATFDDHRVIFLWSCSVFQVQFFWMVPQVVCPHFLKFVLGTVYSITLLVSMEGSGFYWSVSLIFRLYKCVKLTFPYW